MNPAGFKTSTRARVIILTGMVLFVAFLVPGTRSHFDIEYWKAWAIWNSEHGLNKAYLSGTDYTPLYHYVLYLFGMMQDNADAISQHITMLKVFTFLFDLMGLWVVYRWMEKKVDLIFLVFLSVFNFAFIYNTLFWGQVDSILGFFMFFSLYLAWEGKLILSFIMMILAVNFKLQGIVLVPLWLLLFANSVIVNRLWGRAALALLVGVVVQVLIILPFIQEEESARRLKEIVFGAAGRWPFISAFAYNIWYFRFTDPPYTKDDEIFLGPLTARQLGLLAFFLTSLVAMLPVIRTVILNMLRKEKMQMVREKVWLSAALIVLLFFFLNTEMHERYSHPAFLFITAFCFYRSNYFALVIFSLAYFFNLETILTWFRLPNYGTLVFDPRFVATLYLICIVFLFVQLFRRQRPATSLLEQGSSYDNRDKE